jgi:tyrosine-protein phosphatase SIW14
MPRLRPWLLGLTIAVTLTVIPYGYYRWGYSHSKRLREVAPGLVYRSGQMTADGFADAVKDYGIRMIINFQDEFPDPDIRLGYFDKGTIRESELCRRLGVRYVFVPPDLISRKHVPPDRPQAIDRFLALMDDPSTYPVLLHCRAGLHRTGIMVAVFRMEYQGWTREQAIDEMKENGFGEWPCTAANDYIPQYLLTFRPGLRNQHLQTGHQLLLDSKWRDWVHHQ